MKTALETFDGLDNRKTVFMLFARAGVGPQADRVRKRMLERLVKLADNCFAEKMVEFTPCNTTEAYHGFTQICWALGVPINEAAIELERFIAGREGVISG